MVSRSKLLLRNAHLHGRKTVRDLNFTAASRWKRGVYNVARPRYRTPCTVCGVDYDWDPEKDGQFFRKGFLTEDMIQYRNGGYHPVHLEDIMHDGRYKIVQKLGYGRDSTVWLAEDRQR